MEIQAFKTTAMLTMLMVGIFSTTIGTTRDTNVDNTLGVEAEIAIDKDTAITSGNMIGVSSIIDNNEDSTPVGSNTYLFKGDYQGTRFATNAWGIYVDCLLYTSPSPRDRQKSRMPSSA